MLRLKINSSKFGDGWSLDFQTQEDLDQYLSTIGEHWGIPEKTIITPAVTETIPAELDEEGNTITPEQIIEITPEQIDVIPGTVIYTTEDITQEVQTKELLKSAKSRQEFGAEVIARVWAINESKQITAEQFNALLNDSNLARIERLLWTGSLRTAKLLIQQLDEAYFSTEEKQIILDMLVDY